MAIKTINDANLVAIADAIRAKGIEGAWKPSEMAGAIASIQSGGGSSDSALKYKNAEEAYQDLRPAHWMPLMNMEETLALFPNSYGCMMFLLRTTKAVTVKYGNSPSVTPLYVYVDGQKTFTSPSGNIYSDPAQIPLSVLKLNPVDNYYEGIVVITFDENKQGIGWFDRDISGFDHFVDFDLYFKDLETTINNSNYWGNMGNIMRSVRFARLRTEIPNQITFGTNGWSGENGLLVVRRSDFRIPSSSRSIRGPELKYANLYTPVSHPHFGSNSGLLANVLEVHDTGTNSINTVTVGEYSSNGAIQKVIYYPNNGLGSITLGPVPVEVEIRWDEASSLLQHADMLVSASSAQSANYGSPPAIDSIVNSVLDSIEKAGVTLEANGIYVNSIQTLSSTTTQRIQNLGLSISCRNVLEGGA